MSFVQIASWEYGEEKLKLRVAAPNPLEHYKENEEWTLKNISFISQQYHHEDFFVSEIFFNIQIKVQVVVQNSWKKATGVE